MKTTIFQKAARLAAALVLLGIPLALFLITAPAAENFGNFGNNGLVGTWIATATLNQPVPPGFPPDGKFEAVETFHSDGTMSVISNLPGATIGGGVWKQTGPRRFTFSFSFYRLDTSFGPPDSPFNHLMLGARVQENVLLLDGDNYITTDVVVPLNGNLTNGSPIFYFPGTVSAKRYQFSNFNTVLPQR